MFSMMSARSFVASAASRTDIPIAVLACNNLSPKFFIVPKSNYILPHIASPK